MPTTEGAPDLDPTREVQELQENKAVSAGILGQMRIELNAMRESSMRQ